MITLLDVVGFLKSMQVIYWTSTAERDKASRGSENIYIISESPIEVVQSPLSSAAFKRRKGKRGEKRGNFARISCFQLRDNPTAALHAVKARYRVGDLAGLKRVKSSFFYAALFYLF